MDIRRVIIFLSVSSVINRLISMDIASPWDHRGYDKEPEKIDTARISIEKS